MQRLGVPPGGRPMAIDLEDAKQLLARTGIQELGIGRQDTESPYAFLGGASARRHFRKLPRLQKLTLPRRAYRSARSSRKALSVSLMGGTWEARFSG